MRKRRQGKNDGIGPYGIKHLFDIIKRRNFRGLDGRILLRCRTAQGHRNPVSVYIGQPNYLCRWHPQQIGQVHGGYTTNANHCYANRSRKVRHDSLHPNTRISFGRLKVHPTSVKTRLHCTSVIYSPRCNQLGRGSASRARAASARIQGAVVANRCDRASY